MPLEITTPRRSGSTCGVPASAQASRAATSANCSQRSMRRAWTRSTSVAGSAAAQAAIRVGSSAAQSSVSLVTPLRPASSESQVEATSAPTGVIAPSPVTTTLVRSVLTVIVLLDSGYPCPALPSGRSGRHGRPADVIDHVLDGLEVLELVVGNLNAELVLSRYRDLDHRQRVDVQVVDERLVWGDLVGGNAGHLVDDLAEAFQDLLIGHGHGLCTPLSVSVLLYRGKLRPGIREPEPGQGTVITWPA